MSRKEPRETRGRLRHCDELPGSSKSGQFRRSCSSGRLRGQLLRIREGWGRHDGAAL